MRVSRHKMEQKKLLSLFEVVFNQPVFLIFTVLTWDSHTCSQRDDIALTC